MLNTPQFVALDGGGNLFIGDRFNHAIRRVDAATGIITTIAGSGTLGYSGDGGPATSAALSNSYGVAVDAHRNVLIGDTSNNRIRRVEGIAAPTLPGPIATLSATTVNAGTVTKPGSGTATFTITNAGGGSLTVSGITSSNGQFAVSPAPPYNLTASQNQTVTVTFTPTVAGAASATLTITHNASGSPATVTASGGGHAPLDGSDASAGLPDHRRVGR